MVQKKWMRRVGRKGSTQDRRYPTINLPTEYDFIAGSSVEIIETSHGGQLALLLVTPFEHSHIQFRNRNSEGKGEFLSSSSPSNITRNNISLVKTCISDMNQEWARGDSNSHQSPSHGGGPEFESPRAH